MSSQMVLKPVIPTLNNNAGFRSMSSQMVLKPFPATSSNPPRFRSMSSQMVLKQVDFAIWQGSVLDLCHLKWY